MGDVFCKGLLTPVFGSGSSTPLFSLKIDCNRDTGGFPTVMK